MSHSRVGLGSRPSDQALQPAKSGGDARQQHREAARGNLRAASKRNGVSNGAPSSPQLSAAAAALALTLSFLEACLDFCWDHGIGELLITSLLLRKAAAEKDI